MRKLPLSLWLFTFALLAMSTACQRAMTPAGAAKAEAPSFDIDYEKYRLSNGLEVILHEDHSDPIVSVAILFNVGSNREKPGRTGFAHFFEHMLFQSSENVGKGNFFKIINELGGEFNGGTWNDGTVYYEVLPKDALERILWMESDRMGYMINTVTEAVLENEKQVVKNEKRQRVDNQPYGHTNYVIDKAIYPADHPYNWQVIGSLQDLQAATIDDVKEFYEKWYGANNATMVIAGDISKPEVKQLIERYFGEIPSRPEVEPIQPRPGQLTQTVSLMHEDNFAQLPELRMTWPSVQEGHPDNYALSYLGELLSSGKRAPLYKVLVEEREIAPSVAAYNNALQVAGKFSIVARSHAGKDLDEAHAAINEALLRFEQNGIDDRDMDRIKNSLEAGFYGGLSSLLSKSFQLAQYNEFRGTPDALAEEIRGIMAVTKEDVMRVYQRYIKGHAHVITSFVPKGQTQLAVEGATKAAIEEEPIVTGAEAPPMSEDDTNFPRTPSRIDRSQAPALGAPPVVQAPQIWTNKLDNGLMVYGIENSELPLVEFSLRIKGGTLLDDPNKVGVANLITDLMMEGTANKTPEQLEDAIGQLGATIQMSTSQEFITIEASCLARNFKATLALVEEMLLEPRWDAEEYGRIQQRTVAQIQQQNARPEVVSSRVFTRLIYGDDNILSKSAVGTEETVKSITIDDLKSYYNRNFSPSLSSFHVVGSVASAEVDQALSSLESRWAAKNVSLPKLPMAKAGEGSQLFFIDIPDAKQSVIRIGMPGLTGNDPGFFAASLVNERLGGGSSGRLFQRLREERGYTYGAYSSFTRRPNQGFFLASSSVRSNVTREAVELFREILNDYQTTFTSEDLEITRTSTLKSRARAFETLADKIGVLEDISTLGLPLNYLQNEQDVAAKITLDQARNLIGRHINPQQMIYVVAGDAKTQYQRMLDLGFTKVTLLDRNGDPVKP